MRRWLSAAVGALPIAGCQGIQAVLDPHGYSAERIAALWWLMFALGSAVWLVVFALAIHVLFFKRPVVSDRPIVERTEGDERRARWVLGGVAATLAVLVVVFLSSLFTGKSIQALATPEPLTIEIVGHQWWWEVRYHGPSPSGRFKTANEVRIPVDRAVRILLRSNDVIHSFWIPNLAGKTDLIPGRTNTLWVRADRAGVYRGQCAEFCGLQHAKMSFMVVAHTPEEYEAWAAGQLAAARPPAQQEHRRGQQVFLERGCVLCHTIRGTPAGGSVGPDLTHVASRLTLAAGVLPNTRGHLGGWIANPQVIKPGNRMPRVPLEAEELQPLLTYLESLQ